MANIKISSVDREVWDLIRQIAREQAARVQSEQGQRSRPIHQDDTHTGSTTRTFSCTFGSGITSGGVFSKFDTVTDQFTEGNTAATQMGELGLTLNTIGSGANEGHYLTSNSTSVGYHFAIAAYLAGSYVAVSMPANFELEFRWNIGVADGTPSTPPYTPIPAAVAWHDNRRIESSGSEVNSEIWTRFYSWKPASLTEHWDFSLAAVLNAGYLSATANAMIQITKSDNA